MPSFRSPSRWGRRLLGLVVVSAAFAIAGCTEPEKLHPVTGTVTSGGQPVTAGIVTFIPDSGNKLAGNSIAMIEADGSYTPVTNSKKGVPAGKYKVTVSSMAPPGADMGEASTTIKPGAVTPPKSGTGINPRYMSPDTSKLIIDVPSTSVDGYNLKLDK